MTQETIDSTPPAHGGRSIASGGNASHTSAAPAPAAIRKRPPVVQAWLVEPTPPPAAVTESEPHARLRDLLVILAGPGRVEHQLQRAIPLVKHVRDAEERAVLNAVITGILEAARQLRQIAGGSRTVETATPHALSPADLAYVRDSHWRGPGRCVHVGTARRRARLARTVLGECFAGTPRPDALARHRVLRAKGLLLATEPADAELLWPFYDMLRSIAAWDLVAAGVITLHDDDHTEAAPTEAD